MISDVVQQRDDRADRERKLEPEGDENQDAKNAEPSAQREFLASSPPTSAPTRSSRSTLNLALGMMLVNLRCSHFLARVQRVRMVMKFCAP